ncbi:hypothetical protein F2P81_002142 [Scophthalmus maximus]|uniref:Uncharacterized protein n=1 Tax=Scophthalmus maximus TaxID=52904 RepID=A0A6A4TI12_SCOMX|nr:hypothetical protein F2P81_002142 [Scophthalmus maximus]
MESKSQSVKLELQHRSAGRSPDEAAAAVTSNVPRRKRFINTRWRSTVSLTLRRTVEHLRLPLQPDQGARRPRREEHVIKSLYMKIVQSNSSVYDVTRHVIY